MKIKTMWVSVLIAVALVLMAGGAGALTGGTAPAATVASQINYQGRLTDPGGAPLSGVFPMQFRIYDDPGAGMLLWDSGVMNVSVDHGLFNVGLGVDPALFNGRALWLWINVNGEWLWPRQELLPVPYALSLRPGAIVQGEPTEWEGHVVRVNMEGAYPLGKAVWGTVSTGQAVRGDATGGYGLIGYTEEGYAVSGVDRGGAVARGYGGYFDSTNGVGVYGHSSAPSYYTNMYAPGVYGRSAQGAGVYGRGDSGGWPGYGGYFEGRLGVGARSFGTSAEDGYAGSFVSENYRGIFVVSQSGAWYDAYFAGLGGIYSAGGYFSLVADQTLAVNGGEEPLEPGDVVAIAGIVESARGGEFLLAVRQADESNSAAVVGVVAQAMQVEMKEIEGTESLDVQPAEGSIPAKGYLTIVTHGLVPAVKLDIGDQRLEIGDLLTVAAKPGAARKAASGTHGSSSILGKVAGPVDTETNTVPVFVTLR